MTGRDPDRTPRHNGESRSVEDQDNLREQIQRTRAEVGDTVEVLAERSDVKGQARKRAADAANRAKERVAAGSGAARQKGDELRGRLAEKAGPRGEHLRTAMPESTQDAVRRAGEQVRSNRTILAYLAGAVLAAGWLMRRRRRRHRADAS